MHRLRCLWLISLSLLLWSLSARAAPQDPAVEERAQELERHLLAPCCYRETLDVHESQGASALRKEIRRRLSAGESAAQIEASLLAKHGAKMRAELPGNLGYVLAALLFLGGPVLLWLVGRGLQRSPAGAPPPGRAAREDLSREERGRLEERLDDELDAASL